MVLAHVVVGARQIVGLDSLVAWVATVRGRAQITTHLVPGAGGGGLTDSSVEVVVGWALETIVEWDVRCKRIHLRHRGIVTATWRLALDRVWNLTGSVLSGSGGVSVGRQLACGGDKGRTSPGAYRGLDAGGRGGRSLAYSRDEGRREWQSEHGDAHCRWLLMRLEKIGVVGCCAILVWP